MRRLAPALVLLAVVAVPSGRAQFANTEVSPPGSAEPFLLSKTRWTWEDLGPGVSYSVHRSDRPDGGFTCILDLHPTPSWTGDPAPAAIGTPWHYLVTAFDGTVDNSPGRRSDGTARAIDTWCPRPRACCFADGTCADLDAAACATAGGTDGGPRCAATVCPQPTEACCQADGSCSDLEPADCALAGGVSQGAGTDCATTTCPVPCTQTPVPGRVPLRLVSIGATFTSPVYLTSPPGDPRLFILERLGQIILQRPDGTRATFADFRGRVTNVGTTERGALGLAFHPDYATNGLFYVHYSARGAECGGSDNCGTVAEMRVSAGDPDLADAAYERILLQWADFASNHNGGWIAFGQDGYLYVSIGDGGGANDPQLTGQDMNRLLGKMLRLDVDGRGAGQYGIPPDNPFVGTAGAREEIWSLGLRNAWRNSFDRVTGDLYIADVGQNQWEEVDVSLVADGAGRAANYGWSMYESNACFRPPCNPAGKEFPDWEYDHAEGCSITGGYVYRGCRMPDWHGWYFFGDYCSQFVDTFNVTLGVAASYERTPLNARSLVSFGEDSEGELYVISAPGTPPSPGTVYRIEP